MSNPVSVGLAKTRGSAISTPKPRAKRDDSSAPQNRHAAGRGERRRCKHGPCSRPKFISFQIYSKSNVTRWKRGCHSLSRFFLLGFPWTLAFIYLQLSEGNHKNISLCRTRSEVHLGRNLSSQGGRKWTYVLCRVF